MIQLFLCGLVSEAFRLVVVSRMVQTVEPVVAYELMRRSQSQCG